MPYYYDSQGNFVLMSFRYNKTMKITLVTGNVNKLKEWQAIMPAHIELLSVDVDLTEIQSGVLERGVFE